MRKECEPLALRSLCCPDRLQGRSASNGFRVRVRVRVSTALVKLYMNGLVSFINSDLTMFIILFKCNYIRGRENIMTTSHNIE